MDTKTGTIDKNGYITIPIEFLIKLNLIDGDEVVLEVNGDFLLIRRISRDVNHASGSKGKSIL